MDFQFGHNFQLTFKFCVVIFQEYHKSSIFSWLLTILCYVTYGCNQYIWKIYYYTCNLLMTAHHRSTVCLGVGWQQSLDILNNLINLFSFIPILCVIGIDQIRTKLIFTRKIKLLSLFMSYNVGRYNPK